MNLPIYALSPPDKYDSKTELFGHFVYFTKKNTHITPLLFSNTTLNPKNFLNLKSELELSSILIIDRTRPNDKKRCIMNHINRAGYNFLVGNTPTQGLPRFPDMSNIYNPIPGLKTVTAHTVGPKRFTLIENNVFFLSESVGLVSPIWHYIETKVFAQNFLP
jgi:hypothetical protein